MHQLLPKFRIKPINEIKYLLGKIQSSVQIRGPILRILQKMVDINVEINFIADIIVGSGEGVEAAGERWYAVEREDFDDEGEVWDPGWECA